MSGQGTLWSIWTESGNALAVLLKNLNTYEHSFLRRCLKICWYSTTLPIWLWMQVQNRVLKFMGFCREEVKKGVSRFSMRVILSLGETKTWETIFNSHCASKLLSIPNVRFTFVYYGEKIIHHVGISFHIQDDALDLESDAGKEPSCWLKSVVVGDNNYIHNDMWHYVFQKRLILDNLPKGIFADYSCMPEYSCIPRAREMKREHPLAQCAMTSSCQLVMGHTNNSNLVIAFQLLLSLSLTPNQAITWDQILCRNTPSRDLSASHRGQRVIKRKLF